MEKLTLQQAIEQGYEKYCYADDGFQALHFLSDKDDIIWERKLELIGKESFNPNGIDAKSLIEMIADQIEDQHSSETGDDTLSVFNEIMTLNEDLCKPLIDAINEKLNGLHYYRSCGIELVKDES